MLYNLAGPCVSNAILCYSGEELDSGTIKDKAAKISYLDKVVALVGICSGRDIDVRPSKVVAGLEPQGTNALLTVRNVFFVLFFLLYFVTIMSCDG